MLSARSMRAKARSSAALIALLIPAVVAAACSRDHDLAPDPPTTAASSTAGSGGASPTGGVGGAGVGGEGGGLTEPKGPTKLTIINGLADYDNARLCFVPYPDGDASKVSPWPDGASGLAFATALVVNPISDVITTDVDINIFVIAGNLTMTVGKTCAEVFALAEGPSPPVIVAPVGVLPASAFTSERSLLLATTGCLGGPGHSDPNEIYGCGDAYTQDTPTAGLIAVGLSRITTPGKLSLQFVHASLPLPKVDGRIKTGGQSQAQWIVAPNLTFGAAKPRPPFDTFEASDLAVIDSTQVITTAPGNNSPVSVLSLGAILTKSSVKAADIVDGQGFALVAVGGFPTGAPSPWWNELTYVLVRADP